jgi:hypothetical protein
MCHVSLPSSYRSRRGHIHLPRVLPLVGCRSKTPTDVVWLRCARPQQLLRDGFPSHCPLMTSISPPSSTLFPFGLFDLLVVVTSFSSDLFSSPFADRGSRFGTCCGAPVLLGCRAAARAALLGLAPEPFPWTAG